MYIKSCRSLALALLGLVSLASASADTTWTYRHMLEAKKACAEYYFSLYTNGKDHGRNPPNVTDADIQSFYTVARQAAADLVEFADVLDAPYTKPSSGVSALPYYNGASIPDFGLDFPFAVPGYSVLPPKDLIKAAPPVDTIVTLYSFNGYTPSAQVTPDHVYVYGMGMERTVADCVRADWYPTAAAAIAAGVPTPYPGGNPPSFPPRVWASRGTVLANGILKLDSWVILRD